MKNVIVFWTMFMLFSCGQTGKKYENYTKLEVEVEECYDNWFHKNNVDWMELQKSFEEYFISFDVSKADDPIEKQYYDVLLYISEPIRWFPATKDEARIIEIRNQLGLSEEDTFSNKQLDCYTDIYIKNESKIDTASCFYVFGSCFKTMRQIPDISPGLVATSISMSIDSKELQKTVYQKTIILMYYFIFAVLLSDEEEISE